MPISEYKCMSCGHVFEDLELNRDNIKDEMPCKKCGKESKRGLSVGSFKVNGYNFLEPRFYFSRKNKHTDRDKSDWDGIKRFFEMESHLGYQFNQLDEKQWGVKYCENI